jgi:hypothetical protein
LTKGKLKCLINIESSNSFIPSISMVSRGVVMCMDGCCLSGKKVPHCWHVWNCGHGERRFQSVSMFANKKSPQDSATPCFVRISNQLTTHAANNGETHKQRRGVARWVSLGDSIHSSRHFGRSGSPRYPTTSPLSSQKECVPGDVPGDIPR